MERRFTRKVTQTALQSLQDEGAGDVWERKRGDEIGGGEIVVELGVLRISRVIEVHRELRDKLRPMADTSNEHYMHLSEGLGDKGVGTL